jgi:glycosyltransferase involved in cell wall biosynthesis
MPLRLVFLTRRYWPLVGGPEHALAHLAQGVKSLGVEVTLLTPRWQADWPDRLDDHGVRVLRLPHPPRSMWSRSAWRRQLKDWLVAERDMYDLVFVNHLEEEAAAAMQANQKTNRPFVVRPAEWSHTPARFFQRTAKQILTRAAAITADGPALCAALTASGCLRESIFDIPDGVPPAKLRSEATRIAARQELAEADHALLLEDVAPLALYAGPLAADCGLSRLLEAWRIVIDQDSAARLWIVGEGPEREHLARQIQTAALGGRVALVSPFDTLESFYQAADLFVHPGNPQHVPFSLREAMAAGLPCVVSDARTSRLVVEPGWHGMLAEGQSAGSLAKAILNLLSDRPLAERLGNSARGRATETFALAKVAQQHVELWTEIKRRAESGKPVLGAGG